MKLNLHKHILKMIAGLFIISSSFVYADGVRISLYPSKAEQMISCISFFAHKRSVSDLTDDEYLKLIRLAHFDLNIQILSPLPNGNGESQVEAIAKLKKELLEIVRSGISDRVYEEVLALTKTSEDSHKNSSSTQTHRSAIAQEQKLEAQRLLEEEKKQALEVLLKYPKIIIDPENLNLTNKDGETCLHLAAQKNIIELVEALMILTLNFLDAKDKNGMTALMWAAGNGHIDIVRTLLKNGVDPNLQNMWGKTALSRAAFNGHIDIVRTLLENGADPNLQDTSGWTVLKSSAYQGYREVEELMLAYGAKY